MFSCVHLLLLYYHTSNYQIYRLGVVYPTFDVCQLGGFPYASGLVKYP